MHLSFRIRPPAGLAAILAPAIGACDGGVECHPGFAISERKFRSSDLAVFASFNEIMRRHSR